MAINLGESEATVDVAGTILVGTERARDGERVEGLRLGPSDGALLET